jgi:hypothetical protein
VGKIKLIVGVAVFVLVMSIAWQLASCELANYELRDDLKDIASMGGARIGLLAQSTDAELRDAVILRAAGHDINLAPDQILVRRSGTAENPKIFLAAKYQSRVKMPGVSLIFHLKATSR